MYNIILILKQRSSVGSILVFAVIIALVLGFVGHVQLAMANLPAEALTPQRIVKITLDSIPAAMRVFTPKLNPDPGGNGWLLTIGELVGALAAFAALLAVLATILAEFWERVWVSRLKDHSILIGLDNQAELFLDASQDTDKPTPAVILDLETDEASRKRAHAQGAYHYAASDKRQIDQHLKSCAVSRARRLVISTGDDTRNLRIVRDIAESDALRTCTSLDVLVVVEEAYTYHHLAESDTFMKCLGKGGQLRLFSPASAAAADLFSKVNVTQLVHARDQTGPVLIVCGQDAAATEVVSRYLKVSPAVGLDLPQIHWLVRNRSQAMHDLFQRVPPLANLVRETGDSDVPLAWVARVTMHEPAADEAVGDRVFLEKAIGKDDVSAIVVTGFEAGAEQPIQTAQAIREASRRTSALSAPIFVHVPDTTALDGLLVRITDGAEISDDVIEPFGRVAEMQNWGGIDSDREKRARALHEKYLEKRAAEAGEGGARDVSSQPWDVLPETYKIASRRAADHAPMVTFWRDQLTESGARSLDADTLETLARLEHNAWSIERELDGWQYAPERDNDRKFHPNLVPYERLTEDIKDYDRAQVRNLLDVVG